jgi:hypothetical protein
VVLEDEHIVDEPIVDEPIIEDEPFDFQRDIVEEFFPDFNA